MNKRKPLLISLSIIAAFILTLTVFLIIYKYNMIEEENLIKLWQENGMELITYKMPSLFFVYIDLIQNSMLATLMFLPPFIVIIPGLYGIFKIIKSGYIIPDTGEVVVDKVNIYENNCFIPNARAIIEKPTFIDELSGLDNLKLLASIQNRINETEIVEWLKKVGLFEEKNKKYSLYSLGMKQKLAIVQVLMEEPDIMILDEPFNGLDKESYNNMMEIFRQEKEKGKLIIIATHIESDLKNLCDYIYEIDNSIIKQI